MSICLNAIVKNEEKGIHVMLESVVDFIDTYVIVDTGSTDGTKDVIKKFFDYHGIEGEIFDRPWYDDFGRSRTEAIELARGRGDYLLFMDATDRFVGKPGPLTLDQYRVALVNQSNKYYRPVIVKNDERFKWRYDGVLHEYLTTDVKNYSMQILDHCRIEYNVVKGGRDANPNKYRDDARILERELEKDPNNHRNQFYLAQSYRDAKMFEEAMEAYQKRIEMGGWREEVYESMYNIGICMLILGESSEKIEEWFLKVYELYPHRVESLYQLARYFRLKKDYEKSYQHGIRGVDVPYPSNDRLFVNRSVYEYRLKDEVAISSYYVGEYKTSLRLNLDIIDRVPSEEVSRIKSNMQFSIDRLFSI